MTDTVYRSSTAPINNDIQRMNWDEIQFQYPPSDSLRGMRIWCVDYPTSSGSEVVCDGVYWSNTVATTRDASGNVVGLSAGGEIITISNASRLKKWRKALASVRNGTRRSKLLLLGDSTITGSGATGVTGYGANGRMHNTPVALANLLNQSFCAANSNSNIGFGAVSTYSTFDPRYSVSGWSVSTAAPNIGGSFLTNTTGSTIEFTPTESVNTFVIYYSKSVTQGSFDLNIDAEAATTINANAADSIGVATITTATPGTHTLHITKNGASNNYIFGILAYNSEINGIDVIQAGHSGATAATFAFSGNTYSPINQLSAIAPDLTILNLTINDWAAATNVSNYKASMQAIITAANVSGDVILCVGAPTSTAVVSAAQQTTYLHAVKDLASTNNLIVLDIPARFASYTEANSLGMYADTVHPNGIGYADIAQLLYATITNL